MSGYTQIELDDIQAKWNLKFPPDLQAMLRTRRRVIDQGDQFRSFDWLLDPEQLVRDRLNWPLESFMFDIRNGLWWPDWGERPSTPERAEFAFREIFARAPRLIPIYSHRYIPDVPSESGNPIFSVWQMDVIHYGANLDDYIMRETEGYACTAQWPELRNIPFWSRAVEFNNERFRGEQGFRFLNRNSTLPED